MTNPVFFWYPNLIGYLRIVLMIYSFVVVFDQPMVCCVCYATSQLLDALDGTVARAVGQCSKFGACLDMLTDRMSTAVLLIVLGLQYQKMWGFFAFLIVLDIVSHWMQMYSKLLAGASTHKGAKNPLLNVYYTAKMSGWPRLPWLLVFCVGNEAFLICLYLLSFYEPKYANADLISISDRLMEVFSTATAPQLSLQQLYTVVALVSFPIFFGKQFFNVIQLMETCSDVAEHDLAEHKKK